MLDNKVCLVVGASRGIGRGVAMRIGAAGATVIATSRDAAACEAVAREIRDAGGKAEGHEANATSAEALMELVTRIIGTHGGLDLAYINVGGIPGFGPIHAATLDRFRASLDLNAVSVFNALRAVLPTMVAAGAGAVVVNGATGGIRGVAGLGDYCAAKAAAMMLGQVAAQEVGKSGVRVNVIAPGSIGTEAWHGMVGDRADAMAARVPLGRIGNPEDIGDAVVWLLSDAARYVSGAVIPIDGALTAG